MYLFKRITSKDCLILSSNMLFRTFDGELIEINRCDFITDVQYYEHIMKVVYNISFPKKGNVLGDILKLI